MRSRTLAVTTDRRWLTPDDPPGATVQRPVFVPAGDAYEAAFRGALLNLCDPDYWEKFGSVEPEEAAAAFWAAFLETEAAW